MKPLSRTGMALALALVLLPVPMAAAQSAGELSLQQVLQVAMERAGGAVSISETPPYQASSWLSGLPSLSVSYLESNERDGVDEAELSLNLPIKSGQRRRADTALASLSGELAGLAREHRALYFSGLIREAVWSYRIADARRRAAAQKRQLLLTLEQRQQDLVAANASSTYDLLLLQKELVDVEISQQEYLRQARQWLGQYRLITGLGSMPADIEEPQLAQTAFIAGQHPQMRTLEASMAERRQMLSAISEQAADWNLSVNAKNLDAGNYDEDQYGLALEMPLSFINLESQVNNSEWQAVNREYSLAREQLLSQLHSRWQLLLDEAEVLARKQALLARASELSEQIAGQLQDLLASNEIGQDIALRRMMDAIDTRTAAHTNELLLKQNNAMLRQAAGLSL